MATPTDSPLLRAKDAAALLGVSLRTVYALAAPGGPIPCYRIGRTLSFVRADLEAYLRSCRHEPMQKPVLQPSRSNSKLRPSDLRGESDLVKLFKIHGLTPKLKR